MRSSILLSFIVLLFLTSCSGINSEGDTAYIPDEIIPEKPTCTFKATNNCWTRSVALLKSCLEPETVDDVDAFFDEKYCENKAKFIEFPNPSQLKGDQKLNFRVINKVKGDTCFNYERNGNVFTIDSDDLGTLRVENLKNGDIQVQCFFGESFLVPAEAVEKGCRGVSNKVGEYIPRASFYSFQEGEDFGYQFIFQGVGGSPLSIFKCYK